MFALWPAVRISMPSGRRLNCDALSRRTMCQWFFLSLSLSQQEPLSLNRRSLWQVSETCGIVLKNKCPSFNYSNLPPNWGTVSACYQPVEPLRIIFQLTFLIGRIFFCCCKQHQERLARDAWTVCKKVVSTKHFACLVLMHKTWTSVVVFSCPRCFKFTQISSADVSVRS